MSCTKMVKMMMMMISLVFLQGNCHGTTLPSFKIKAVNLGGWLVTEGWIFPALFDMIPNKDLLDGTQIQLKSVKTGMYLCAELGGGNIIVANRSSASDWETFRLWRIDEDNYNLKVNSNQFIGLSSSQGLDMPMALAWSPGTTETLTIVRKYDDWYRVRIQASNGMFLQARTPEIVTADYSGSAEWGDDNPSVFELNVVSGGMQGEYQVTNGYGPDMAPKIMRHHWDNFILEEDFKFMASNGINAVRIPVGWWIASGNNPPKPFVGGSLEYLDKAFSWALNNNIMVIIDLHAAPGSQNGMEHSATRDGTKMWGTTDVTIQQTVSVIDFLTARYANHPSLYAVELLNEPFAPGVTQDMVTKYYQLGYNTVRKYTKTAYVILSNRLGNVDMKELFPLASGMDRVVIDVHYYNLFDNRFSSVQQNLDFVYGTRGGQLGQLTTSDGPLTFVGEWTAEWAVDAASKEDYQNFGKAQLQVYGKATFGWAYWSFKNVQNHWSLKWMISNGYITL